MGAGGAQNLTASMTSVCDKESQAMLYCMPHAQLQCHRGGNVLVTLAETETCVAFSSSTSLTSLQSTRMSCWQVMPKSARAAWRAGQATICKPAAADMLQCMQDAYAATLQDLLAPSGRRGVISKMQRMHNLSNARSLSAVVHKSV